jgi:hypothetical protein
MKRLWHWIFRKDRGECECARRTAWGGTPYNKCGAAPCPYRFH